MERASGTAAPAPPLGRGRRRGESIAILLMMIYLLMSGPFPPVDYMPRAEVAAECNPLRPFVSSVGPIMIRGAGLADVARAVFIFVMFAIGLSSLAVVQCRYVGPAGVCIGMETLGASALLQERRKQFGFIVEPLVGAREQREGRRVGSHAS